MMGGFLAAAGIIALVFLAVLAVGVGVVILTVFANGFNR